MSRLKIFAAGMTLLFALSTQAMAHSYFNYAQNDIRGLHCLESDGSINDDQLQEWDKIAAKEAKSGDLPYFKKLRLFTYLYVAQGDAASLACAAKGAFKGSLDPVSYKVLSLFFPDLSRPKGYRTDHLSEAIASIVATKIQLRMLDEDTCKTEFRVPEEHKEEYTVGLYIAGWRPWALSNPQRFWPAPPTQRGNKIYWKDQVTEILKAQTPMDGTKKKAIKWWAGKAGDGSGDWRVVANDYLFDHPHSLASILRARGVLMVGLYDGVIVCFGAKYCYMFDRPKKFDDKVKYEVECPKHPSYPSGHSTESSIAAQILCCLFPCDCQQFRQKAEEACLSRIWGGIHYPVDDYAGRQSGMNVAQGVLQATGNDWTYCH